MPPDYPFAAPPLFIFVVCIARMGAAFAVVPFLNSQLITGVARQTIIISMALILFPLVGPTVPPRITEPLFLMAVVTKEVFLGMLMGFVAAMPFYVADGTGFFIDNQRGTTMASVFNPLSGDQTSPMGIFLNQTVTTLFFSVGGFLAFLGGIFGSYKVWPIFSFFPHFGPNFPIFFLQMFDHMMSLIVLFASPLILVMFLAEFGLGLMNRFAQQLNVFVLAMPVKAGISSFMIIIYMAYLFIYFKDLFVNAEVLQNFFRALIS